MLLIGLTGSISNGKSTVSRLLTSAPYNLPLIDADLLSRSVVAPGTSALAQIVAYFGPTTPGLLHENGELNRAVLGNRVFGLDEQRRKDRAVLNGIVHPRVRREMYKAVLAAYFQGHWAVVLDIPLLFETGLDLMCGAVVVVAVTSREVQLQRLLARDKGITREDALRRIESNIGTEGKMERLQGIYGRRGRGWVVNNDGDLEHLKAELERAMAEVGRGRMGWWRLVLWALPPVAAVVGMWVAACNWWSRRAWMKQGEVKGVKAKL